LLQLSDVQGLTLKGFIFDGEGRVPILLSVCCGCRNLTLDELELRNYTAVGIGFRNCMAYENQPVIVTGVKANSTLPPLDFK